MTTANIPHASDSDSTIAISIVVDVDAQVMSITCSDWTALRRATRVIETDVRQRNAGRINELPGEEFAAAVVVAHQRYVARRATRRCMPARRAMQCRTRARRTRRVRRTAIRRVAADSGGSGDGEPPRRRARQPDTRARGPPTARSTCRAAGTRAENADARP